GADDAEDHHEQPDGGDDLAQPEPTARPVLRRPRDGVELEHDVGDDGAGDRAGDLRADVRRQVATIEPAEERVSSAHDRVEVAAGHGTEREDQRDEPARGGGRVLEQLEADVAAATAGGLIALILALDRKSTRLNSSHSQI